MRARRLARLAAGLMLLPMSGCVLIRTAQVRWSPHQHGQPPVTDDEVLGAVARFAERHGLRSRPIYQLRDGRRCWSRSDAVVVKGETRHAHVDLCLQPGNRGTMEVRVKERRLPHPYRAADRLARELADSLAPLGRVRVRY